MREGDFLPPGFDFSVVARKADAAGAAEGRLPQFEGEVNGIQVQVPRSGTFGMPVQMCSSENFGLVNDLEIDYLPPGTYEHSPQFKGVCADGATAFVMQSFETRFATFEIIYIPGRDHIDASVPAHRVVPDTFDGIDGVMVQPVIEEGFGPSTAAVKLDDGLLFLQAENLPLEQSRLIMNGLKCSSC